MSVRQSTSISRKRIVKKKGRGLVSRLLSAGDKVLNKAIDLLPVELHLPSYNYCGPGTKLARRLARGDKGVNPLDEACKAHDIAYSKYSDSGNRRVADNILASKAWSRVKSSDASLGERAAALAVSAAMKAKTKLGGGRRRRRSRGGQRGGRKRTVQQLLRQLKGKGLYLKPYKKGGGRRRSSKKKKH